MSVPNRENWLSLVTESGRLVGTIAVYGAAVVGDRVLNRVFPLDREQRAAIEQAAAQSNVWKSAGELGLQHIAAHQAAVSESEWLGHDVPGAVSDVPPSPAPGRPTSELLRDAIEHFEGFLDFYVVEPERRRYLDEYLISEMHARARLLSSRND